MFERWTEQARRAIFFARYEASQFGDTYIGCVHILLALLREQGQLFRELGIDPRAESDHIRNLLQAKAKPRISVSVEVPLDDNAKKALNRATEIAERQESRSVFPVHMLWGVLEVEPEVAGMRWSERVTQEQLEELCEGYGKSERVSEGYEESEREEMVATRKRPPWRIRHTRLGIGYDLHRLVGGRKLILGGVEVSFEKGPAGHSDGDVLSHAICDALLGAAGLGDIGTHFPDTDPKWKGVSSLLFLEHVRKLLAERGLNVRHIDAIVITEKPKLGPHFPAMREALARALDIRTDQINLKAKTNEGVDAIGRGEAIAAQAIATLED